MLVYVYSRCAGDVHRCVPRPPPVHQGNVLGRSRSHSIEFVATICTLGLDTFLAGSEFGGVHRGSLVECAIGGAAFDIDWDIAAAEAEYGHKVFCLYNYDTGQVYGCDVQIGYTSVRDRRTYRKYEVRLRASATTLE